FSTQQHSKETNVLNEISGQLARTCFSSASSSSTEIYGAELTPSLLCPHQPNFFF
ncbi:Hypothetical predicted protein, partial [Podarcis lilfordi]